MSLRNRAVRLANRLLASIPGIRQLVTENRYLTRRVSDLTERNAAADLREDAFRADYIERSAELIEARSMAGAGPWLVAESRPSAIAGSKLRESNAITSQGAFGDIELALQNIEWRREVNLSWLEFSRWGIQQIILVSRLYFIKNPLIQRGINISASYVFGRGFEVSSPDEAAQEVITDFLTSNSSIIGLVGLIQLEKRLYYDGQVFFVFFSDRLSKGATKVRTLDATEIQDIITNPDDTDEPWFYRRTWTQRHFNDVTGAVGTKTMEAWYPALNYEPTARPEVIGGYPVMWDSPVYHMRSGSGVSKWHFDVPLIYAALDWAKAARKFLEACATVKQSLAQISMTLTTKGGQQALEGAKQQLQTQVNSQPGNTLWDTNPPPNNASIFGSGPGTKLEAFRTAGAGGDPEEVRRYIHMVAMVFGIPETFFADASTGSLATAQSLDRPTELRFMESQERWRQTLIEIVKYVLRVNQGATSGRMRASDGRVRSIVEAARVLGTGGRWTYAKEAAQPKTDAVMLRVDFPAIREGDMPQIVAAIAEAMTLGTQQVIGIDEKTGVRALLAQLGVENADEIVEEMYPEGAYEPDRTIEPPAPPQPIVAPGGNPGVAEAALALVREAKRLKSRAAA